MLSFRNPPDYEAPADADHRNDYLIRIKADDGPGGDDPGSLDLMVTLVNVNEPPAIMPTGNITRLENSTGTVADYSAADPEGVTDTFTWSLSGDDADDFTLHEGTGFLTFSAPPDYDNPTDANGDNSYLLTIGVTDGDLPNLINVEVTVADVNEPPVVMRSNGGTGAFSIVENSGTEVGSFVATEPDGDDLEWSVAGIDGGHFEVREISGSWTLSFKANSDYDNPLDTNLDKRNTYHVTVRDIDALEPFINPDIYDSEGLYRTGNGVRLVLVGGIVSCVGSFAFPLLGLWHHYRKS